jgi:hypothetical protein
VTAADRLTPIPMARYVELVIKVDRESEDADTVTLYCCRDCGSVVRYWGPHNAWHEGRI